MFPCVLKPLSEWQDWQIGALPISVLLLTPTSGIALALQRVPSAPEGQPTIQEEDPACALLPGHSYQAPFLKAVLCHGEPETPATAGSSRWPFPIQALPVYFYTYQASYACKWHWGGGELLSSIQPACLAHKVKVPLSEMPLHVRVIELPSCMPLNVLIFSYHSQSHSVYIKHKISECC